MLKSQKCEPKRKSRATTDEVRIICSLYPRVHEAIHALRKRDDRMLVLDSFDAYEFREKYPYWEDPNDLAVECAVWATIKVLLRQYLQRAITLYPTRREIYSAYEEGRCWGAFDRLGGNAEGPSAIHWGRVKEDSAANPHNEPLIFEILCDEVDEGGDWARESFKEYENRMSIKRDLD